MPDPAQTPGLWVKAAGNAGFSAECVAALVACGIHPDAFGSYSAVQDKINDCQAHFGEGSEYTDPANAAANPEAYLNANSESGHMVQDAVFRGRGQRGSRCANIGPDPINDPNAPSSFGYNTSHAPCTPHFGDSRSAGTVHGNQSQINERAYSRADRDNRIDDGQMSQLARTSARELVNWNRNRHASHRSYDATRVESLANAQQQTASALQGTFNDNAGLGDTTAAQNQDASTPEAAAALQAAQDTAVECIVAHWENEMAAWRQDVTNNAGVAQPQDPQPGCPAEGTGAGRPWSELSQQEQQQRLQAQGLSRDTPPTAPSPPMTQADCDAYQANHLAWQQAYGSSGSPPAWGGRNPGVTSRRAQASGAEAFSAADDTGDVD